MWSLQNFAHAPGTVLAYAQFHCDSVIQFLRNYSWILSMCYEETLNHYTDAIMTTMASQITSLTIVYSTVYSGADQRKRQSSGSLAFVGNSSVTGEFPAQMASNAENVSIWWRHHAKKCSHPTSPQWRRWQFQDILRESSSLGRYRLDINPTPKQGLTHCGLLTPNGDINLGELWLRQMFVAWLTTPSHYLNQCWIVFKGGLWR